MSGALSALAHLGTHGPGTKGPDDRAPVGRMLEWHQLKLVGGLLTAAVPLGPPGKAAKVATMPSSEVAEILDRAQTFAENTDQEP